MASSGPKLFKALVRDNEPVAANFPDANGLTCARLEVEHLNYHLHAFICSDVMRNSNEFSIARSQSPKSEKISISRASDGSSCPSMFLRDRFNFITSLSCGGNCWRSCLTRYRSPTLFTYGTLSSGIVEKYK